MPSERILLVVAHPDDETIAAGAQLKHWPCLTMIHVTDGAPRDGKDAAREGFGSWQAYRDRRRLELDRALAIGEASNAERHEFGIADQAAVQHLPELIGNLRTFDPDIVITHAYEGGHPDHDACAFAVCAVWGGTGRVWEFAGYHNSPQGMETGCFLNPSPSGSPPFPVLPLITGEDLLRKSRMLECFRTQDEVLGQFRPEVELFRPAPQYDFGRPPHEGALLYETWGFPISSVRWRQLATESRLQCR